MISIPLTRIAFLAALFGALILLGSICNAQSIDRSDEGLKYAVSDPVASIVEHETWKHDNSEGKWTQTTSADMGNGLDNFDSIQLRTITLLGLPRGVLIFTYLDGAYKYPEIKEDFYTFTARRAVVLNKFQCKKDILKSLDAIDSSKESSFTPGAQIYTLPLVDDAITEGLNLGAAINSSLQSCEKNGWHLYTAMRLGIFPVVSRGNKEVRLIVEPSGSVEESIYNKIDTKQFDEGYFTIPLNDFRKFIQAIPE